MIMAYWNGMRWEVSGRQIAYLESLTTAYSIDTDTNADKEGQKPTESVGAVSYTHLTLPTIA